MIVRTYDSVWKIERRLYAVRDLVLLYPVSWRAIGWGAAVGIPWVILLRIVGVPWDPGIPSIVYLTPPAVAIWASRRPLIDGKTLAQLAVTALRMTTTLGTRRARRHHAEPVAVRRRARIPHGAP